MTEAAAQAQSEQRVVDAINTLRVTVIIFQMFVCGLGGFMIALLTRIAHGLGK